MSIFSSRLKELREDKGLTLKELGNQVGISDVALGRWERATRIPSIESLMILVKFFGVTAGYLLGLED